MVWKEDAIHVQNSHTASQLPGLQAYGRMNESKMRDITRSLWKIYRIKNIRETRDDILVFLRVHYIYRAITTIKKGMKNGRMKYKNAGHCSMWNIEFKFVALQKSSLSTWTFRYITKYLVILRYATVWWVWEIFVFGKIHTKWTGNMMIFSPKKKYKMFHYIIWGNNTLADNHKNVQWIS